MANHVNKLRQSLPKSTQAWIRWEQPTNFHLTLKFLGSVSSNQVDAIKTAIESACKGYTPFEVCTASIGCFPSFDSPRIIWTGLGGDTTTLGMLHNAIESTIAPLRYPTEKRAFHPHITLGRVRTQDKRQKRALGQWIEQSAIDEIGRWTVDSVQLMRSELSQEGAIYTTVESFPLDS